MVDEKLLEKKLTFERKFNYEGSKSVKQYLLSLPDTFGFMKTLIGCYSEILNEDFGRKSEGEPHFDYYRKVAEKLSLLGDLEYDLIY